MFDPALAACAPHVSPATLAHIVRVESSGNPLAVNVNVIRGRARFPVPRIQSAGHAAQVAHQAIAQGYNVDLGLMQVNSRNLRGLGYSVEQMFEPCTNVRAGARILTENYSRAVRERGHGQSALLAALSAYNTGNFSSGFQNGYVSKYFNIRSVIYSQPTGNVLASNSAPSQVPVAEVPNPYTAELSVYSRERVENDRQPAGASAPTAASLGGD